MTWSPPHSRLVSLHDEVLRWNQSFSMISRLSPEVRAKDLIEECWSSFHTLKPLLFRLASNMPLTYFDLGTGGGFPGLVWALALKDLAPPLQLEHVHLVEPRRKRAWFLERQATLMGLRDLSVHEHAWGSDTWQSPSVDEGLTLVSLKALALTDQAILDGFQDIRGSLLIARFLGGHESAQADFLGLPAHQADLAVDAEYPCWMALPYEYFEREDQLVLSYYPHQN